MATVGLAAVLFEFTFADVHAIAGTDAVASGNG